MCNSKDLGIAFTIIAGLCIYQVFNLARSVIFEMIMHEFSILCVIPLSIILFSTSCLSIWSLFSTYYTNPGLVPEGYSHPNRLSTNIGSQISSIDESKDIEDQNQNSKSIRVKQELEDSQSIEQNATNDNCEEPQEIKVKSKFKKKLIEIAEFFGEIKIDKEKVRENYQYMTRYNFCERCDIEKPPRTHHCSYCNRCVMRLDHHCYIIGQCIGFGNIKQFILFTLYTFIDKSIGGFCLFYIFSHNYFEDEGFISVAFNYLFLGILCILFSLLCIFLFSQSMLCAYYNTSAIEVRQFEFNNPFTYDKISENLKEVFGVEDCFIWYLLPTKQSKRLTEGFEFPISDNVKQILHTNS